MKKIPTLFSKETLKYFIFILLLLIPVGIMFYTSSVLSLNGHELWLPYGRNFFNPEHGRYIGTAFERFCLEQLPLMLNVHTQDFRPTFIASVVNLITVILFSIIAYGFLLFKKHKNKNDLIIWALCYLTAFFVFFNDHFGFLFQSDIIIFFEYTSSLIPYFISLTVAIYLFTKQEAPSKSIFWLFLIMSFFTGLSIEFINVPYTLFLGMITLFVAIDYFKFGKNEVKKSLLKLFIYGGLLDILACIFYYIQPTDHAYSEKYMFFTIWKDFFPVIFKITFTNVISLYVSLVLGIAAVCLLGKNERNQKTRFVSAIVFNTVSLLAFYVFGFYIILCFYDMGLLLKEPRYIFLYIFTLFFQGFMVWGYAASIFKQSKRVFACEISLILFILLANSVYLKDYVFYLNKYRQESLYERQRQYYIEGIMMEQVGNETLVFPKIFFDDDNASDRTLVYFLKLLHYPDFDNAYKIIIYKKSNISDFMDEDSNDLKFSKYLKHRIIKYGGVYFTNYEKTHEEEDRAFFDLTKW